MAKVFKTTNGRCPYCNSENFGTPEERREGQDLIECQSCDKWSVRTSKGVIFPLLDPSDKETPPQTFTVV